jgi:adenylate kinase family enzyme
MYKKHECDGFIIDGFPQTLYEAKEFEKHVGVCNYVLYLEYSNTFSEENLYDRDITRYYFHNL